MVEFTICPFCGQDTRKLVVRTEKAQSEATDSDNGESVLHYTRCENCNRVWIEYESVSES